MNTFAQALSWINVRYLLEGFMVTLEVSAASIVISFILGTILGIIRYVKIKWVSAIVGFIIDIIRNLPLLLLLFFVYFGLPEMGVRLNAVSATIIALSIFEAAMIAEIVRSGINAVSKGQMEAARANGMTYTQAMVHIILPQALRKMIPPIVSQFISLIKDTSLATIILLPEVTFNAQLIYGQNVNYMIPMYVALAVLYFVVNYLLSLASRMLAKRLAI
ncbi:amino acid ABC transporter permease [Lacticaseibacillus songhuajiangensis]|jgi:putative glutamine transport system permease protein|uniref:amino acid ABC transporter permease n=1 Tax=Lacticaseibacillus songhuajiangensis TaxID=1296539 RepID=UPI000F7A11BC|nr:amino acid ABC transporter permease [Lacticaseibacillus songhuajiangensis]MCI1283031.1 amino acid ABC transporter permease [Lacticaseibacillus songhuajiangensis]